jgi:sugar phosphate isomerase/epimerase
MIRHASGDRLGVGRAVERVLAFHAEIGCSAVELTVLPGYATALERLDAAERARVRGLLRRPGLTCSGIANIQRLTDPDPAAAAAVLARQRAGIDLAVELATGDPPPPVVCFAGGAPDEWPAARERLIERLGALAEHARSRGVTLAFKAHVASAVRRPAQLLDLFEQIGSPALRFCFDMSHYETQGLSIEQAL